MRVFRKRGVVSTISGDDETLLHDSSSDRYFSVNETGAFLWSVLHEECTAAELEIALIERYGLSPDAAEKYVGIFVRDLISSELIDSLD